MGSSRRFLKYLIPSSCSENRLLKLNEESANQTAEFTSRLRSLKEELESEGGALRRKLEERRRSQEREKEGERMK